MPSESPQPAKKPRPLEWLAGLAALAGASLAGDALSRATHAPIPGTVLGLLLLLGALALLGGVPRGLAAPARWLISHMNLFYVPAAVGVTVYARLLYRDVWPIAAALLFGTWLAMAVAALTYRAVARALGERAE